MSKEQPADKTTARWYSERMGREASLVRWGTQGQPLLVFPTAGGDAEEIERMHLVRVVRPLIDRGLIKLYSCDSVAGMGLVRAEGTPRYRMWLQNQFHQYVRHEVVPAIRQDCRDANAEIWTGGASIGAFHAVAVTCRFPDVFSRAIGMSGTYDLRRFYKCDPHDFNDDFWASSPVHFLSILSGPHLDMLKRRFILMPSGEGRAEDIGESFKMAQALGRKGVPNRVDSWGRDWPHDWDTWRKMLPQYLEDWTKKAV